MTIRHMCVRETNENDEIETDVINNKCNKNLFKFLISVTNIIAYFAF